MRRDSVAGRCSSSDGTSTCAVMIVATPASIAALNGRNSTARSRSGGCSTSGSSKCESVLVSPCPGKCLPHAAMPFGLQRPHDRGAEPGDVLGLLRQRAIADDRVLRVGVDVEDRRVIEGDADALQLGRERSRESLRQLRVAAAAERRHRRPLGERRLEARDAAAFLIDRDPGRQIGHEARGIERQLGDLLRLGDVAGEQDDAAEAELLASERSSGGIWWPLNPAISS